MNFEWDEAKNRANRLKHGIGFEQAMHIFDGWTYSFVDSRRDYGEVGLVSIGDTIVATVVHTDRQDRIRIISARPASAKERKVYEATLQSAIDDGRAR